MKEIKRKFFWGGDFSLNLRDLKFWNKWEERVQIEGMDWTLRYIVREKKKEWCWEERAEKRINY